MLFFWNREEVYIGYSFAEMEKVRDALAAEKIEYQWRNNTGSSRLLSAGSKRGGFTSFGMNMDYANQYSVFVKRDDYERAKYLVDKALNR